MAMFTNNVYIKVTLRMFKIVSCGIALHERIFKLPIDTYIVEILIPFILNFALEYTMTIFVPHIPDLIPISQPNITQYFTE